MTEQRGCLCPAADIFGKESLERFSFSWKTHYPTNILATKCSPERRKAAACSVLRFQLRIRDGWLWGIILCTLIKEICIRVRRYTRCPHPSHPPNGQGFTSRQVIVSGPETERMRRSVMSSDSWTGARPPPSFVRFRATWRAYSERIKPRPHWVVVQKLEHNAAPSRVPWLCHAWEDALKSQNSSCPVRCDTCCWWFLGDILKCKKARYTKAIGCLKPVQWVTTGR